MATIVIIVHGAKDVGKLVQTLTNTVENTIQWIFVQSVENTVEIFQNEENGNTMEIYGRTSGSSSRCLWKWKWTTKFGKDNYIKMEMGNYTFIEGRREARPDADRRLDELPDVLRAPFRQYNIHFMQNDLFPRRTSGSSSRRLWKWKWTITNLERATI